jgi:superfamily II DNA/RNA helicase
MGAKVFVCMGGTNTKVCKAALLEGRQVVVGTTGRIAHMMSDDNDECIQHLSTTSIKTLALDEADKMLNPEFSRDITEVNKLYIILSKDSQSERKESRRCS